MSRVLIVDDYLDALDVWSLYLRSMGYEVLTAKNGDEAIAQATTASPDIIVLDLDLPGKSGIEVAGVLRSQLNTRDIPLVAATGHSHSAQLDLARKAGFDAVVVKPCDPDRLLSELQRLLSRRPIEPGASSATGKPTA
ncbi:MAG: response regulator [Vicinamibacterales bacterium]